MSKKVSGMTRRIISLPLAVLVVTLAGGCVGVRRDVHHDELEIAVEPAAPADAGKEGVPTRLSLAPRTQ